MNFNESLMEWWRDFREVLCFRVEVAGPDVSRFSQWNQVNTRRHNFRQTLPEMNTYLISPVSIHHILHSKIPIQITESRKYHFNTHSARLISIFIIFYSIKNHNHKKITEGFASHSILFYIISTPFFLLFTTPVTLWTL